MLLSQINLWKKKCNQLKLPFDRHMRIAVRSCFDFKQFGCQHPSCFGSASAHPFDWWKHRKWFISTNKTFTTQRKEVDGIWRMNGDAYTDACNKAKADTCHLNRHILVLNPLSTRVRESHEAFVELFFVNFQMFSIRLFFFF